MDQIRERTSYVVAYTFADDEGEADAPVSGRYRIDNVSTGRQVRTWTSIDNVAASGTILLTPDDTAIQDRANASERIVVQVEGTYSATDVVRNTIELKVTRVGGFP